MKLFTALGAIAASTMDFAAGNTMEVRGKDCGARHGRLGHFMSEPQHVGPGGPAMWNFSVDTEITGGTVFFEVTSNHNTFHYNADLCQFPYKASTFKLSDDIGRLTWSGLETGTEACPVSPRRGSIIWLHLDLHKNAAIKMKFKGHGSSRKDLLCADISVQAHPCQGAGEDCANSGQKGMENCCRGLHVAWKRVPPEQGEAPRMECKCAGGEGPYMDSDRQQNATNFMTV